MPLFFFDVFSGESQTIDLAGVHLADEKEARATALQLLASLAHDDIPQGGETIITVRIRREGGVPIYSATATLTDEWLRLDS